MGYSEYESTVWKSGMLSRWEDNILLEIKVMRDSAGENTYEVEQKVSSAGTFPEELRTGYTVSMAVIHLFF